MVPIKKLLCAIDTNLSNNVDIDELKYFIVKKGLAHKISPETAEEMFWDAAHCRRIVYERNKYDPLSAIEIFAATRIKYLIDHNTKKTVAVPRRYR